MRFCTNCGHELGIGRFCTNCGHPVADDWRTGTAERPAVPAPAAPPAPAGPPAGPPVGAPTTPPPTPPGAVLPPPRFPLFADEVAERPVDRDPHVADRTTTLPAAAPAGPPPGPPPGHAARQHRRRRPWAVWAGAAAALLVVAGFGAWALSDDDGGSATDEPGASAPATGAGKDQSKDPTPGDVTSESTVAVPATAPPNQDVEGNEVTFDGANMLDRVPETCWRMPGDGTGQEITITLPGETVMRSVGLINGYAKSAVDPQGRELDWYHGNRRVLAVEWVFDDGTTVPQDLDDTSAVQSVDVDGVTTSTITLRLVSVSEPGKGRAARDNTAISDLSLVGGSAG